MQEDQSPTVIDVTESMLDAICTIEATCQQDPWSKGNFLDAIKIGYKIQALLEPTKGDIMGYYVAMKGVDEVHLLNINIAPEYQRQGCARTLLEFLRLWAMTQQVEWIWLEVRESNARAQHVYERFGFHAVGTRKNYYKLENGEREHAVLMTMPVC